ncbi:hypothetical protein U6G28_11420 [Actinomycetaceae bacterium MB13-C1-2]|nr:hypothetical protein U6G28_11420 [Actinomycetaceae bacterium MB13-C1-2]
MVDLRSIPAAEEIHDRLKRVLSWADVVRNKKADPLLKNRTSDAANMASKSFPAAVATEQE